MKTKEMTPGLENNFREKPQSSLRRRFLNWLLGGSLFALFMATVYPILRFLFPQEKYPHKGEWTEVAFLSEVPVGKGKIVRYAGKPVYIIQPYADDFRALSAVCTHLGCIVQWGAEGHQGHFYCVCHDGIFDAFGNVIGGPPPKPLPSYEVKIADDKILVKKA